MMGVLHRSLVAALGLAAAACTATDTSTDTLQARCAQLDAEAVTEPMQGQLDATMSLLRNGAQFGDVPCGQECIILLSSGAVRSLTMRITAIGAFPGDDRSTINRIFDAPGYWRLTRSSSP